ncbi:DNA polymerase I, partial [Selenomonadales bacterium OttesenSCG-928-I06]|nr:DNA polymerase I [Selenomonadales bacterium OttesenSCG-928-I06]
MSKELIIIDGNSLVYRAFHALPFMTTKEGLHTNAAYGFTTMLTKLINEYNPKYIVVAFDKGKHTFRNEIYEAYKANRKETPLELREQIPLVEEILEAWDIKTLKDENFEADDIIGTLAHLAKKQNFKTTIVTSDRDILQLVDEDTKVLLNNKGISDVKLMDTEAIIEKYGVTPKQIIDLKSLMGDKSDNIPGVRGIGEKTAVNLIQEFENLENILNNTDKISAKRVQNLIETSKEDALLSKKLATIITDMPLAINCEDFSFSPDNNQIKTVFEKLEFRSFLKKMNDISLDLEDTQMTLLGMEINLIDVPEATILVEKKELEDFYNKISSIKKVYYYTSGQLEKSTLLNNIIISFEDESSSLQSYYFSTKYSNLEIALKILSDKTIEKITYDSKKLYNICNKENIAINSLNFDIMLAAYLLMPTSNDYSIENLASIYDNTLLNYKIDKTNHQSYLIWISIVIYKLEKILKNNLNEDKLSNLFETIEMPLVEILSNMECTGIKIDTDKLERINIEISEKIDKLIEEIHSCCNEKFNINSPKQLGVILFEKLELPIIKKTKSGYSTDVEVLEKLEDKHPIISKILEYRTLTKLKSTYLDGLKQLVNNETKRIHTHFNQMVTVTGRLSSSEPNLQNIPIRTEIGKQIRELFIVDNNYSYLLSADYSQIELRILAHIANDEKLIQSFLEDEDIHLRTAAEVFNVNLTDVTPLMRIKAKAVNFGIVYGISDYGLSRDLKIPRDEASIYIKEYFSKYQGVKNYIDEVIKEAKNTGYVSTLFGRRRFLPDINSSNFNRRSFAERTAMNTPIQGTAADIIKLAMIKVYDK